MTLTVLAVDMDIQAQISKTPPRKIYKWGQRNCDDIRNDSNIFRDAFMSVLKVALLRKITTPLRNILRPCWANIFHVKWVALEFMYLGYNQD